MSSGKKGPTKGPIQKHKEDHKGTTSQPAITLTTDLDEDAINSPGPEPERNAQTGLLIADGPRRASSVNRKSAINPEEIVAGTSGGYKSKSHPPRQGKV